MSNFDQLERENIDENTVVSIIEPKKTEEKFNPNSPNVFSVLLATIKQDKKYLEGGFYYKRLPNMRYTVLSFLTFVALALILLIANFFLSLKTLLPMVALALCVVPIAFLIIFFYEFNTERTLSVFYVFISFLMGFLIHVLLNYLSSLVYRFIAKDQIEQIAYPIIYTIVCFLVTFLLSNTFKRSSMTDCFLISVAISLGFCFTQNLSETFDKLFIVDGIVQTGSYIAPPGAGIMINTSEYLQRSYDGLFVDWFYKYLVIPHLFASWSVVVGYLASLTDRNNGLRRNVHKSLYLILMLVMLFYFLAVWNTTIGYLSAILKIASLIGSTIIEFLFLNIALRQKKS